MVTGAGIRQKRKTLSLSAENLAHLLGVKVENLYKWEKGTRISDPIAYNKIDQWLKNGKLESVPPSANLAEQVYRLQDWQAGVMATLAVLTRELEPILVKASGKTKTAFLNDLRKDIEIETENQLKLLRQAGK